MWAFWLAVKLLCAVAGALILLWVFPIVVAFIILKGKDIRQFGRFTIGVDNYRAGWGILITRSETWTSKGQTWRVKSVGIHWAIVQISWN